MATGALLSPRSKESFEDHDVYDFHDEDDFDAQATDEGKSQSGDNSGYYHLLVVYTGLLVQEQVRRLSMSVTHYI